MHNLDLNIYNSSDFFIERSENFEEVTVLYKNNKKLETEKMLISKIQNNPVTELSKKEIIGEGGVKQIRALKDRNFVLITFREGMDKTFTQLQEVHKVFHDKLLIGTPFKISSSGSSNEAHCILMPKMRGDLWVFRQKLDSKGKFTGDTCAKKSKDRFDNYLKKEPDNKIFDMALRVCEDVKILHDQNWIHGDIHPSNILFSTLGILSPKIDQVRLSDFDTTTHMAESQEYHPRGRESRNAPELKKNGFVIGPEASKKIDIYSLGCTLFSILSSIKNPIAIKKIQELENKMLSKNPEERPSIEAIISELNLIKNLCAKDS